MVEAKRRANRSQARYKNLQVLSELRRSQEASMRQQTRY
jgi:hypothetical protein